jgi:hypothetical protein
MFPDDFVVLYIWEINPKSKIGRIVNESNDRLQPLYLQTAGEQDKIFKLRGCLRKYGGKKEYAD